MIEVKAKETEKFAGRITNIKEEKQEGFKQIDQLEKEVSKLELQILAVKDEKNRINFKSKIHQII
jgi:septal ring factor EnvC (AmiA/AmiB activator)